MRLSALLDGVTVSKLYHSMYGHMVVTHDVKISGIQYDSRKVEKGNLFVAMRGTSHDGHAFISNAISNGASAVVLEDDAALPDSFFMHSGVVKIVVANSRRALAQMAANFYGHPSRKLTLICVTGTNGKTTTTYLIKQLLESNQDVKAGMIGTVEYDIGDDRYPAIHTTPESLELNQLFAQMVERRCTHAVMEVSSHALHQARVFGLEFAVGVFTNLTQDHLDYHGTMEEYFRAKKILFDSLSSTAVAVINADSEYGIRIASNCRARKLTYGITSTADIRADDVEIGVSGFTLRIGERKFESGLMGQFNVYNFLAAYTAVAALDIPLHTLSETVGKLKPAPGRFEQIHSSQGWTAIVDYAHTPDALRNCLQAIHDVLPPGRNNRIVTVFGAGGDRDKVKRPLMGSIVERMSDVVIVTSDNPRTENPEAIMNDIIAGIGRKEKVHRNVDRRAAIEYGLSLAAPGDVVLVAGKGHEDYQVLGTEKIHFSDREVIREYIAKHP